MKQTQTLFLFSGFNNYYNRQVKRFDYLEEYPEPLIEINDINFNFNDGVSAELVLNLANAPYSQEPDYALTVDITGFITRWFVMDTARTRNGQSRFTLRRDVAADFYNEMLDAPCFIEKAIIGLNNNLIFNSEAMTYNQIKQAEYPLKDRTQIPWIVGYIARNIPTEESITVEAPFNTFQVDGTLNSWDSYKYAEYIGVEFQGDYSDITFAIGASYPNTTAVFGWDENGNIKTPVNVPTGWMTTGVWNGYITTQSLPNGWTQPTGPARGAYEGVVSAVRTNAKNYASWRNDSYSYTEAHKRADVDAFLEENGKIYKVGDDYFRVNITLAGTVRKWAYDIQPTSGLGLQMKNIASAGGLNTNQYSGYPCNIIYSAPIYMLQIEDYAVAKAEVEIKQDRTHLTDAPYDMFCIPYGEIQVLYKEGYNRWYNAPEVMMSVASSIYTELGATQSVYDLQLLPYCPLNSRAVRADGKIDLKLLEDNNWVEVISDEIPYGILFWCDKSNFTAQLIDPELPALPDEDIEFKVAHETEFYRIVSPNYNGSFEIKATSNRGLSGFTATCSYKPFSPYIKVAPKFGGLYGGNYGDARGLICGGDFSLPVVSDAWANYQIQNKNYQVMFDRQIQNMEVNNAIQMTQAVVGAFAGAATGGVQGYMMGSLDGGKGGAGGAALGVGISAIGGLADIAMLNWQQKETLDYTKDQFGYQLGNIQAQPHSLTKVSSFNADNKTFPFLEFYTCSEVEKDALRDKIRYNGMTVMTIGTMREHLQSDESYIKGRLVRMENVDIDYHILLELATEINQGVFIK